MSASSVEQAKCLAQAFGQAVVRLAAARHAALMVGECEAAVERARRDLAEAGLLPGADPSPLGVIPDFSASPQGAPSPPLRPHQQTAKRRERILAALPGTAREIRDRTSLGTRDISNGLSYLKEQGLVTFDGVPNHYVWRLVRPELRAVES